MEKQEINLEVIDEIKPLNSEEQYDMLEFEDQKKTSSGQSIKISFISSLFFLWTLDAMRLSNKNQLKKDVIRKSALFTSSKNKEKLNSEFLFLKKLWLGTKESPGYSSYTHSPLILTIARFNFLKFLELLYLLL